MKYLSIILGLSLFLFFFLRRKIDLYSLEYDILNWEDLDPDLQQHLVESKHLLFDLDKNEALDIKNSSIVGIRSGKISFRYNGKRYAVKALGNREAYPFLIKGGKLYCLYNERGGTPMFKDAESLSKFPFYCFSL
ncbi:MAG: hypothetical protein AAF146_26050 [Bacteroidota bacterium]